MKELILNKWFWVALICVVPFIAIWIVEGMMAAIVFYVVIACAAAFFMYQIKGRSSRRESPTNPDSRVIIEDRRGYGRVACPQCDGQGRVQCHRCNGRGRVMNLINVTNCSTCRGRKSLRCGHCGGGGYV